MMLVVMEVQVVMAAWVVTMMRGMLAMLVVTITQVVEVAWMGVAA